MKPSMQNGKSKSGAVQKKIALIKSDFTRIHELAQSKEMKKRRKLRRKEWHLDFIRRPDEKRVGTPHCARCDVTITIHVRLSAVLMQFNRDEVETPLFPRCNALTPPTSGWAQAPTGCSRPHVRLSATPEGCSRNPQFPLSIILRWTYVPDWISLKPASVGLIKSQPPPVHELLI